MATVFMEAGTRLGSSCSAFILLIKDCLLGKKQDSFFFVTFYILGLFYFQDAYCVDDVSFGVTTGRPPLT